ncbi:hypothetical protein K3G39_02685 [Pontibacter sp. HSC-14F20]|uniref:hypothetical protein n=1 Tax=Pontibacter sp. HSC-14F20 TaxID=2864136 RepID=UPI001C72E8D7|nr:hypothetical protein [Pontibacter sp. HSC-14F20]MBX0332134.1 hypothetical protein [Pontibacter sp. HSC-14F20]
MEESWGTREFKACGVEDRGEAKSLSALADRLLEPPEMAFSSAVGKGLRKAAWRLFSKEEVDVSCGHYPRTAQRCQDCQGVLVSQDTTWPELPVPPCHGGAGRPGRGQRRGEPGAEPALGAGDEPGGPAAGAGKGHRGGASSRARACSLVSAHHHPGGR